MDRNKEKSHRKLRKQRIKTDFLQLIRGKHLAASCDCESGADAVSGRCGENTLDLFELLEGGTMIWNFGIV